MEFQFNLPVNIIFGCGRINEAGNIVSRYGKRALVVTGGSSTKKSGLLDRVIERLSDSGVKGIVFDKVKPNPLTTTAIEGAEIAKRQECDVIVGIGGMVINCAGVTLPHGMEHPASGLKNIVHGQGLAELTPVIMEKSINGNMSKYADISRSLGGKDETDCTDRIVDLLEQLDMRVTLSELGIHTEDIEWMTSNCMKVSAAGISNHPVVFNAEQIKELYRLAIGQ